METIERNIAYKLFSMAVSYPENEVAQAIETGWLFQQINKIFNNNEEIISLSKSANDDFENIEDLQVVYTTCFDLKIPLYESFYTIKSDNPEEKGKFLFELEKFYLNAGVELADRDMPDYLPTELEFMHYLSTEKKIDEQKLFLEKHLLKWIVSLSEKVNKENIIFYKNILKIIEKFLILDFYNLMK